jgi:hypothetical protein
MNGSRLDRSLRRDDLAVISRCCGAIVARLLCDRDAVAARLRDASALRGANARFRKNFSREREIVLHFFPKSVQLLRMSSLNRYQMIAMTAGAKSYSRAALCKSGCFLVQGETRS